ncbi:HAMP domain-containing sensor histidine kinase [Actinomadura scrupuli]|uniref:HAMP domain-containing sensor histidine kinase n=1 Tax=Actinomadura scrupuli TaxID=559629 RepID=UPI003D981981
MTLMPRLRSIQARYTTTATALLLIVLIAVGVSLDLATRYKIQDDIFFNAQRVAGARAAMLRYGGLPHLIPDSPGARFIQVVDVHGSVLSASREASGKPPMSSLRPPADDRLQKQTRCSWRQGCIMLMADRVTPAPDSPILYAGVPQPALLRGHRLEGFTAGGALVLLVLGAGLTWYVVGRMLRPVAAIRARMSEITVSDLSLRVPMPPGEDEIVELARTANQTLARLEAAVEQQRQFASTASHELRTPITSLNLHLEEALRYPDEVDPREAIRSALAATGRLGAIVDDLLLLARLRAADPAPRELIDLGTLVREEAAQFRGPPVHVHSASDVRVRGSRIQLIRVLSNLLSNAERHAETGVEIFVESADGQATVTVVDDGVGIEPADRERVFERFTRLDDGRLRDAGGSGLGLAISRDIANAHNGTLGIEDSPRGARFVLRLPLGREDAV